MQDHIMAVIGPFHHKKRFKISFNDCICIKKNTLLLYIKIFYRLKSLFLLILNKFKRFLWAPKSSVGLGTMPIGSVLKTRDQSME